MSSSAFAAIPMPWLPPAAPLVAIDVTGRCNLRCTHCYNADYLAQELSPQRVHNILTSTPAPWKMYFLGGEPLLRDDILAILEQSVALGHPTSLATNGTRILKVGAERLLQTGVTEIYLSLDGADALHNDVIRGRGRFEEAVEGLLALDQAARSYPGVSINISTSVGRQNLASVAQLPAFLDGLGVYIDKLGVMPISPIGRAVSAPELSLTERQWLDLAEVLCADWRRYPRLAFLCIANSELTVRYLEAKYRVFLNECVADCRVVRGTDAGRVLADGRLVPCSGRLDLVDAMTAEGSLPAYQVESLGHEAPFEDFIRQMSPHLSLNAPICARCPYQANCQICPLEKRAQVAPRMSREAVCAEVWRRVEEQKIELKTEDSLPSPLPMGTHGDVLVDDTAYLKEIRTDGYLLVCPRDQSFHRLARPEGQFWRDVAENRSLAQASQRFLAEIEGLEGYRRLARLIRTLADAQVLAERPS